MIRKYIKRILKPSVAKRAKAMKRAKKARISVKDGLRKRRLAPLEEKLGYEFQDKTILIEALTHPGTIGVSKTKVRSNQRLEFLGDAVLQAVITDVVYKKFSDSEEGELTKIRIALTQGKFLAELSQSLGIPKFLIIPKGASELRMQSAAAEDAFEAVVGAIYLDSDFQKVRDVVLSWYSLKFDDISSLMQMQNPKGALQEIIAKRGGSVKYALVSQSGPDHKKVFEVEVIIDGEVYASAVASSKKLAETEAAQKALSILNKAEKQSVEKSEKPKKKKRKNTANKQK